VNTPDAILKIDSIREAASNPDASREELQSLIAESLELSEISIEAIIYFQVAEQLHFMATGVKIPDEIVHAAVNALIQDTLSQG